MNYQEDDWSLDDTTLADRGLDAVLREDATATNDSQPLGQVAARTLPSGSRTIWRALAKRHGSTYSAFSRGGTKLGAVILDMDSRMRKFEGGLRRG